MTSNRKYTANRVSYILFVSIKWRDMFSTEIFYEVSSVQFRHHDLRKYSKTTDFHELLPGKDVKILRPLSFLPIV